MKRTLVLVLCLTGWAGAAPHYSVKLRVNPALAGTQAVLVDATVNKKNSCSMVPLNGLLFCKVPAGKYLLSIYPLDSSFGAVRKVPVVVKGNSSFIADLPKVKKK